MSNRHCTENGLRGPRLAILTPPSTKKRALILWSMALKTDNQVLKWINLDARSLLRPCSRQMASPILYEVNTRLWLRELSEKFGHPITLANVPESEIALWKELGFTHIWLMGL